MSTGGIEASQVLALAAPAPWVYLLPGLRPRRWRMPSRGFGRGA